MINTDTLNLLRLNSVSPCQPRDRNTHKYKLALISFLRLDCQLAYSWQMVALATPDVTSEGLVAEYFQFCALSLYTAQHIHTEGP